MIFKMKEILGMIEPLSKMLSQKMEHHTRIELISISKNVTEASKKFFEDIYSIVNEQNVDIRNKEITFGELSKINPDFYSALNKEVDIPFNPIKIEDLKDIRMTPVEMTKIGVFLHKRRD